MGGTAAVGALATTEAGQKEVKAFKDALWQSRPGRHNVKLGTANVDDWSIQVGTEFQTSTGHTLKLAYVQQFDHQNKRPTSLRDRPFVAEFEVQPGGPPLPNQLLVRVNHREGGTFDMFLTAAGPAKPKNWMAVYG